MKRTPSKPETGQTHYRQYEPILKRGRMEHYRAIGRAIKGVVQLIAHSFQHQHDHAEKVVKLKYSS
ncbi:hypothetical protein [Desulfopila sp. IMCC35008]|uniref:hypothetical protein n=1 Tax=Desulfopila sp. IMCC35008 TaxID=2653858 RepID=UPI0013D6B604|nr:hypothetical protein [Desulfopila sp. IMCC35008]